MNSAGNQRVPGGAKIGSLVIGVARCAVGTWASTIPLTKTDGSDRPETSMGITIFYVEKCDEENASMHFKGRNGGAMNWRHVVDALDIIVQTAVRNGAPVERPDKDKSLGQGGRIIASKKIAAELLLLWRNDNDVRKADARGEITVENSALGEKRLKRTLARLQAEGALDPTEPEASSEAKTESSSTSSIAGMEK